MPEPMSPQPMTPTFLIATSSTLSHAEHFNRRTSYAPFAGGYRGAPGLRRGAPNMRGFGAISRPHSRRSRGPARLRRDGPNIWGVWGPFRGPQYYRRRPGRGGGSKNSPPGGQSCRMMMVVLP